MMLLHTPVPREASDNDNTADERNALTQNYQRRGVDLDWRIHVITTDLTSELSQKDSEGFFYRFVRSFENSQFHRIDFACVRQTQSPTTPSLLSGFDSTVLELSNCPQIIISFANRVFSETARGMSQAIQRTFPNLIVAIWPDMDLSLLNLDCPIPLQIAIAPHEQTPLLPRYIVYQMEQTWSAYMGDHRFQTILKEAVAVWTFSRQQYQLLSQIGVPPTHFWCLPLYTDRRYSDETMALEQSSSPPPPKTKDVMFFGSASPRRRQFAIELTELSLTYGLKLGGVVGGPLECLYHRRRDALVRQSKVSSPLSPVVASSLSLSSQVVVNVHTEQSSALEVHRLNYLLSMGACVISERSSDPEMDQLVTSPSLFLPLFFALTIPSMPLLLSLSRWTSSWLRSLTS
jgi:hypothetical protein